MPYTTTGVGDLDSPGFGQIVAVSVAVGQLARGLLSLGASRLVGVPIDLDRSMRTVQAAVGTPQRLASV